MAPPRPRLARPVRIPLTPAESHRRPSRRYYTRSTPLLACRRPEGLGEVSVALPRAGTTTPLAPVARHGAEVQVSQGSTGLSQAERRMDPPEAATRRGPPVPYLSFGRSGPAAGAPSRRPTFRPARPGLFTRRPTFRLFDPIKLGRRPAAITAAAPPAITAPTPTEVDLLTAGSRSHRTAQTLVQATTTTTRENTRRLAPLAFFSHSRGPREKYFKPKSAACRIDCTAVFSAERKH